MALQDALHAAQHLADTSGSEVTVRLENRARLPLRLTAAPRSPTSALTAGERVPRIGWSQVNDVEGRVRAALTGTSEQTNPTTAAATGTYTYDALGRQLTIPAVDTPPPPAGTPATAAPSMAGAWVSSLPDSMT